MPRLCVIVEVQRRVDRRKPLAWLQYVPAARRSVDCPVVLMVLALDPAVAAWARRPIPTGHPGYVLRPVVISAEELPATMSRREALRLPELGVLRVVARPTLRAAKVALHGLSTLDSESFRLYFDVIMHALSEADRRALEDSMLRYEYQSEFARRYVAEGLAKGKAKGKAEGLAKGRLEAQRDDALALARAKVERLTAAQVAAIRALVEPARLSALVLALGLARSARQARQILREHLGGL